MIAIITGRLIPEQSPFILGFILIVFVRTIGLLRLYFDYELSNNTLTPSTVQIRRLLFEYKIVTISW